ncbi:unnamed protein product, partial [Brassica rapa subsp. trilocularis]
ADLGGSSIYSNENFEGGRGERFHVKGTCTWRPLKIRRTECRSRPVVLITASGLQ